MANFPRAATKRPELRCERSQIEAHTEHAQSLNRSAAAAIVRWSAQEGRFFGVPGCGRRVLSGPAESFRSKIQEQLPAPNNTGTHQRCQTTWSPMVDPKVARHQIDQRIE